MRRSDSKMTHHPVSMTCVKIPRDSDLLLSNCAYCSTEDKMANCIGIVRPLSRSVSDSLLYCYYTIIPSNLVGTGELALNRVMRENIGVQAGDKLLVSRFIPGEIDTIQRVDLHIRILNKEGILPENKDDTELCIKAMLLDQMLRIQQRCIINIGTALVELTVVGLVVSGPSGCIDIDTRIETVHRFNS